MTALEFAQHCLLFDQFGKIKDIDFEDELFNTQFSDGMYIRDINFESGRLIVGELKSFGCGCCGDYFDEVAYNLDDLAKHGYLGELIDMMDQVLKNKTGI